MKKNLAKAAIFLGIILTTFSKALAICPVCTVAVGAGVGLAKWLGIDDTITGLWIGALVVSLSMWTIAWMERKKWKFFGRDILTFIVYYAFIVIPLFFTGIMGHKLNKIWGIDKLLLGIFLGSLAFFIFAELYLYMKKKNHGRAYFPFQKVVMPVAPLIILSAIFYFITK